MESSLVLIADGISVLKAYMDEKHTFFTVKQVVIILHGDKFVPAFLLCDIL